MHNLVIQNAQNYPVEFRSVEERNEYLDENIKDGEEDMIDLLHRLGADPNIPNKVIISFVIISAVSPCYLMFDYTRVGYHHYNSPLPKEQILVL